MSKTIVNLEKLVCIKTSESGNDEVYLKILVDGHEGSNMRVPYDDTHDMDSKDDEDTWPVDLTFGFRDSLSIELYDNDGTSGDDFLVRFVVTSDNISEPFIKERNPNNDAEYALYLS